MSQITPSMAIQTLGTLRTIESQETDPTVKQAARDAIDVLDDDFQTRVLTRYLALAQDPQQTARVRVDALTWVARVLGGALQ